MFGLPFTIGFAPFVPEWVLIASAGVAVLIFGYSLWRHATGAFTRLLALAVIIFVLANPQIVRETRDALDDVAVVVVDRSMSQEIGTRREDTERTLNALRQRLEEFNGLEVREAEVRTDAEVGTPLFGTLDAVLGQVPPDRLAGTIVITDGQAHDAPELETFAPGAPFHVLLTGAPDERDRKLTVVEASRFSIVGSQAQIKVKVEDNDTPTGNANVSIRVDGRPSGARRLTIGQEMTISLPVTHGGENIIELEVAPGNAEQTLQNNRAVVVVNGVRDRLSVLLVSGQPHAGERVWRDLLKSDPSVDLVHFTILRSPDKLFDDTPIEELALIQFPTRELFDVKLKDFDLVVFDRYQHDDLILPLAYIDNIARYVEGGGALLVASGPELADPEKSVYRTPLATVLPVQPTGEVMAQAYRPNVTNQGLAHPVTQGLEQANGEPGAAGARAAEWGRWYRLISSERIGGMTLMDGPNARPLLVLDRVGQGRVAQLLSDQIWLWARGYEGGGPNVELLRRLAHWLMKEPDLEEERLQAEVVDGELRITRRTMSAQAPPANVTTPTGEKSTVELTKSTPGVFVSRVRANDLGLYHVNSGNLNAVAAAGPLNPREVADMRATDSIVRPYVEKTEGTIRWIRDGAPQLREVEEGSDAYGAGWLGISRRGVYRVTSVDEQQLLPPWVSLLMVMGSVLLAWKRESK
jgi:hypothetical protein